MKSYFPDVNVWIALAWQGHTHHIVAESWLNRINGSTVSFCRLTQLGFLRLLTQPAVMQAEVRNQIQAWGVYDLLMGDPRVTFCPEPDSDAIEGELRTLTMTHHFAPQRWSDAYLIAFAKVNDFTLVTFDGALKKLAGEDALFLHGKMQ